MKRNFVKKDASTNVEFMVEGPEEARKPTPLDFIITPETLMKGLRGKEEEEEEMDGWIW